MTSPKRLKKTILGLLCLVVCLAASPYAHAVNPPPDDGSGGGGGGGGGGADGNDWDGDGDTDPDPDTIPPVERPSGDDGFHIPVDEAAGPRYRKIALNGAPLPDGKPQTESESDEAREETNIDALTLQLRHDITDLYTPIPASDLYLGVRRTLHSEIWNLYRYGLRPDEKINLAFGAGWRSNIEAGIEFAYNGDGADTATVTDDQGQSYRFAAVYSPTTVWSSTTQEFTGGYALVPLPSAENDQQSMLTSLVASPGGTEYVFKRKYGTTLVFTKVTGVLRHPGSAEFFRYARLSRVTDRYGNKLEYTYTGSTALIPSKIQHVIPSGTGAALYIYKNSAGLVDYVVDNKGNRVDYGYETFSYGHASGLLAPTDPYTYAHERLVSAAHADSTTHYAYDAHFEADVVKKTDSSGFTVQQTLRSITDGRGKTYRFWHTRDFSKQDYSTEGLGKTGDGMNGNGYYPKPGMPWIVQKVQLPDESQATFVTTEIIRLKFHRGTLYASGRRLNTVTDALGNRRRYEFYDCQVDYLRDFQQIYRLRKPEYNGPRIVYYKRMRVSSFDGDATAPMGVESFEFSPRAGMAPVKTTDFSGNTTAFVYSDAFSSTLTSYPALQGKVSGLYGDPNTQTNVLGGNKTYRYGFNRIMNRVVDELGNATVYRLDAEARGDSTPVDSHSATALDNKFGRRLSETQFSGLTTPLSHTVIDYPDTWQSPAYPASYSGVSLNFVTRKTVMKLASSADPTWVADLVTAFIPDAQGRVWKEIVDPAGLALTTTHTYDGNGNKLTTTDPRGKVTTFEYDTRNRLTKVIFPYGHQKRFFYDANGNKTKEIDENGVATLREYDAFNRVVKQVIDLNANEAVDAATVDIVTAYGYNKLNAKTSVTDPNGNTSTLAYDALQRLVSQTDALGKVTRYVYGANSGGSVFESSGWKPTQVTDPRGFRTKVDYDGLYRPVVEKAEYKPDTYATTTKAYDAVGNLVSVTDPLGTITVHRYDALRRPVATVEAVNTSVAARSQVFYTTTGFAWKSSDWLNRETLTEYDKAGRPIRVTTPPVPDPVLGGSSMSYPVTTTGYDAAGNVVSVLDPLNRQTTHVYDDRNRRTSTILPEVVDATTGLSAHPVIAQAYDAVGSLTHVTDARGNQTVTEYDPARRPKKVTAPQVTLPAGTLTNPVTQSTYFQGGQVRTVTDPNGHTITNTYDVLNRLQTTTDAAGIVVAYEYDFSGNRTAVTDGENRRSTFQYDGLGRNTLATDAAGRSVSFAYNALNKTSRSDALGQLTYYNYDVRHRLTSVTYDGRPSDNRTYTYDAAGQLLAVQEPGKSGKANVAYAYDQMGRLLSENAGGTFTVSAIAATDSGSLSLLYYPAVTVSGGVTHAYAHDQVGNRLKVVYGGTGTTLVSTYDDHNRLKTLTEGTRVTTYGYDKNGNRVKQELPNGDLETTTFDKLNRRGVITTTAAGATLLTLTHAYDAAGNLARLEETYAGSALANRVVTNTYDNANRLDVETVVDAAKTVATDYDYDRSHNRTQRSVATTTGGTTTTVTTAYAYNTRNQLLTATEGGVVTTYTYDFSGNRQTRVRGGLTDTYAYDYENRLVVLFKNTPGGIGYYNYVYDYRTRRVERNDAGAVTRTVYSGGVSVSESSGSTLNAEFVRGSDWGGGVGGLLYSLRGGTPSFKHYNSRGDVITATNASGVTTWQASYEAFGRRTQETGTTLDRQKANTKEEDPTGLLNEGFRYRDLETGAFITRDPLGFVDGPNVYAYVVQNPWSKFDPEGLSAYSDMSSYAERQLSSGTIGGWFKAAGTIVAQQAWQMASIGTASKNGAIEDRINSGEVSMGKGVTAMIGNGAVAGASLAVGGGLGGGVVAKGGGMIAAGAVAGLSQAAVQTGGESTVAALTGASAVPTMGQNAAQIGIGTVAGAATGGLLKAAAAGDAAIAANAAAKNLNGASPIQTAQMIEVSNQNGRAIGAYNSEQQHLHISMYEGYGPGGGTAVLGEAAASAPGPVTRITGRAGGTNEGILDRYGFEETPWFKSMNKLGYTNQNVSPTKVMSAEKPPK